MPNVTNKSLREAGVPEALWGRAKKQCSSQPYRASRRPYHVCGGPFGGDRITLMLDDGKTAPFRVGKWYGFYERASPATFAAFSGGTWLPGTVEWRDLP